MRTQAAVSAHNLAVLRLLLLRDEGQGQGQGAPHKEEDGIASDWCADWPLSPLIVPHACGAPVVFCLHGTADAAACQGRKGHSLCESSLGF